MDKKTSTLNKLTIEVQGNGKIDNYYDINLLHQSGIALPYLDVVSSGNQWYISSISDSDVLVASDNLVGWWKLDEASSTIASDSSGNYDGTLQGGITFSTNSVTGKLNQALYFSGITGQKVSIGDVTELDNASTFSISAWVKRASSSDRVSIQKYLDDNNLININVWSDGNVYINIKDGSSHYGSFSLSGSDWHHIAMVFDGTQTGNSNRLKAYANSVLQSLSFFGTIPSITPDLDSFDLGVDRTNYSTGSIDDVRIYNKVLSLNEIQALYQLGQ